MALIGAFTQSFLGLGFESLRFSDVTTLLFRARMGEQNVKTTMEK